MDRDEGAVGEDRVEVKTSFGSIRAFGSTVVVVVVVIAATGLIAMLIRDGEARAMARAASISQQVGTIKDSMDENTYVQTLTADEKKNLKLDMPESLRHKVRQ